MLSSCLWGSEEKKDENQNRTQEKRNYISFNSKSFSPAGSRASTAIAAVTTATTAKTTKKTTWEATSQEKDVFGSALWFGSVAVPAPVVVVVCCCSCCCCCCLTVCCLLVRISKSFIIILWHWECRPALPHPLPPLLVLLSNTLIKTLNRSLIYVGIGIRVLFSVYVCVLLISNLHNLQKLWTLNSAAESIMQKFSIFRYAFYTTHRWP